MINYELAKKLKDAGFPQKGPNWACRHMPQNAFGWCDACDKNKEDVYLPPLSELIEACGYDFRSLSFHSNKRFVATGGKAKFGKWMLFNGSTSEEAVAMLYLALKDNK